MHVHRDHIFKRLSTYMYITVNVKIKLFKIKQGCEQYNNNNNNNNNNNDNNNNNNNNLYFTRVTQSNTAFDFRCGPLI